VVERQAAPEATRTRFVVIKGLSADREGTAEFGGWLT